MQQAPTQLLAVHLCICCFFRRKKKEEKCSFIAEFDWIKQN